MPAKTTEKEWSAEEAMPSKPRKVTLSTGKMGMETLYEKESLAQQDFYNKGRTTNETFKRKVIKIRTLN